MDKYYYFVCEHGNSKNSGILLNEHPLVHCAKAGGICTFYKELNHDEYIELCRYASIQAK